jgi:hypothetical protein
MSKQQPIANLLPFHPVAIKFGNLNGAEFDALVNDIKTNKQKVPIVRHKGLIIDGIQRYRACLNAKVEPIFTEYDGEEKDIVMFIASMNMHRRHLSTKHKKEIALELLKANPAMPDLAVAKATRLSDKTVTTIRADAVRHSEIPNVEKKDIKGRRISAKPRASSKPKSKSTPAPIAAPTLVPPVKGVPDQEPVRKSASAVALLAPGISEVETAIRAALAELHSNKDRLNLLNQLMKLIGGLVTDVQRDQSAATEPTKH